MSAYDTQENFPLVGVGASAGGIESFQKFLKAIPANSGIAYLLVQRLSPTHESILQRIHSPSPSIPVLEIDASCRIEPDHVYVIPENTIPEVSGHSLKLTPCKKGAFAPPIDTFFSSLAREHGIYAMGVVLSGTPHEGCVGLKNIRDHGGITFAEDPGPGAWDGMPKSAILSGVVDLVLPVEEIPTRLNTIRALYEMENLVGEGQQSTGEGYLKKIVSEIMLYSGVDFSCYKQSVLMKRIIRRMVINQCPRQEDYLVLLGESRVEQDALFSDLLRKVTPLFREPEVFDELSKNVFPFLVKDRAPDDPIRVWVPACSTGEDAYALAFGLFDSLGGLTAGYNLHRTAIKIFASDISSDAIKKARAGIFSAQEIEPLPDWQREDYFTHSGGNYRVVKPIRDTIVFTVHNFMKDPPFGKVDLVSCRDIISCLHPEMQRVALETFHYALKENGFLQLGKSETAVVPSDSYTPVSDNGKIYKHTTKSGDFLKVASSHLKVNRVWGSTPLPYGPSQTDFRKSADAILVSRYIPASVIVDDHLKVVHFNNSITPFLLPSHGKPTHALLKMANKELEFDLRAALDKARNNKEIVITDGIPILHGGERYWATIEVVPLTDTTEAYYLILFRKKLQEGTWLKMFWKKMRKLVTPPVKNNTQWRIAALERELERAREDMHEILEEQEAYTEELQSAQEEMLSSNEEMRSLNEELESSRQELQTTVRELTLVNMELQESGDNQARGQEYLDIVLEHLREPFVILEKDFSIKAANASYFTRFGVTKKETVGKPFFEVHNKMWGISELRSRLQEVLALKKRIRDKEIRIKSTMGKEHSFLFNAREIKGVKEFSDSILLSIEDFTPEKEPKAKNASQHPF